MFVLEAILQLRMLQGLGGEQHDYQPAGVGGSLKGAPKCPWTLSTPYTAAMNLLKPPVKSTWGQGFVPPAWRVNRACPCTHTLMIVSECHAWHEHGAACKDILRSRYFSRLLVTSKRHLAPSAEPAPVILAAQQ